MTIPKAPLFSVIIPFHNAERTLPETLASLQAQTEIDWEALLIDDASSDRSLEIARAAAAADPRLRLLHHLASHDPPCAAPRGPSASRNLGIAAARGQYLALLDADDLWLPGKLAAQRKAFEAGADIVFTAYRRIDMTGRVLSDVAACPQVRWADALIGNPIGASTAAWRRQAFPQARMESRSMHEDYAFWLKLLRAGGVAQGLPEVLAEYRVSPRSRSAQKLRAAWSVWSILGTEGLGLWKRLDYFLRYAMRAIRRRTLEQLALRRPGR